MTAYNTYDIGDRVRVSVTFTDDVAAPADPTTVTVKYKNSGTGTLTSKVYGVDAEVVKDDTGDYHIDIDVAAAGIWHYKFIGTGAVVAVEEGYFKVKESNVVYWYKAAGCAPWGPAYFAALQGLRRNLLPEGRKRRFCV